MSTKSQSTDHHVIGIISDTHGLLRPEAVKVLEGTDLIIHAGDIDTPEILEALRTTAPIYAVRGNMDKGAWAHDLPKTQVVEVGEVLLYVLHDALSLDVDPAAAGFSAVITGHTHKPTISRRDGVLFLNPGTAGPFRSLLTVAILHVRGNSLDAQLIELNPQLVSR
jgi:putative phosphoesterase